jgi:uncharacterized protein YkwD
MRVAAFAVAAAALVLAGCSIGRQSVHAVSRVSTAEAAEAARLITAYRTSRGLSGVAVDTRLNAAAEHQARAVAEAGKLSHGDFPTRMAKFGIGGASAENLAAGQDSVAEAVSRWKASPGHNENLLMPEARYVGLARADANGGYGRYWTLVLSQ